MAVTVTVRRLQRETPAVLREVEEGTESVIVTRDNEEIARIVPLGAGERLWRSWVREAGGDPDDPRYRRTPDTPVLPARAGGSLSQALAELRDQER